MPTCFDPNCSCKGTIPNLSPKDSVEYTLVYYIPSWGEYCRGNVVESYSEIVIVKDKLSLGELYYLLEELFHKSVSGYLLDHPGIYVNIFPSPVPYKLEEWLQDILPEGVKVYFTPIDTEEYDICH